jgi:hypothetical protein
VLHPPIRAATPLNTYTGDLWSLIETHHLVIPTNIGYRRDRTAIMGVGLAKQAAQRWPALTVQLGEYYAKNRADSEVVGFSMFAPNARLFAFPVKPLAAQHNRSWQQPASLELITKSAQQLASIVTSYQRFDPTVDLQVAVPRVGCGNGGLDWAIVEPVLRTYLSEDCYTFVSLPSEALATTTEFTYLAL